MYKKIYFLYINISSYIIFTIIYIYFGINVQKRLKLICQLRYHTKIEFVVDELSVTRITATKYLEQLVEHGFLKKQRIGRANYYINEPLCALLASRG